jgi:hypothetical protein
MARETTIGKFNSLPVAAPIQHSELADIIATEVCENWEVPPHTQEWAMARDAAAKALRQPPSDAMRGYAERLEAALRISLWNEARSRGASQDAVIKEVADKIAALTQGKPDA